MMSSGGSQFLERPGTYFDLYSFLGLDDLNKFSDTNGRAGDLFRLVIKMNTLYEPFILHPDRFDRTTFCG